MTKRFLLTLATAAALTTASAGAKELAISSGTFGKLDHVFLIVMENQTNTDIIGNANAPFINAYASVANSATDYFAVGHPSAPNYLEMTGGSNFGLTNDYWPNWLGTGCVDNSPGSTGCNNDFAPIQTTGTDNPVVATASQPTQCNGQITTSPAITNNCALYNYPAATFTPKSIADQLVAKNKSWKAYEQGLPIVVPGAAGINYADGAFSNLSPVADFGPGAIQKLYAVKHDPFVYFANVEAGTNPNLSLNQVVDFDGPNGLWADLEAGTAPNLSFIVPDQCHDMHGFVSGGPPYCSTGNAFETGMAIQKGDATVAQLVTGIKASKAWQKGRNAIVVVWDENDYSDAANQVVMLVETNYAPNGRTDGNPYDHYSLLKTLEAGFGLSCLNHACDSTSVIMNTMFGGQ